MQFIYGGVVTKDIPLLETVSNPLKLTNTYNGLKTLSLAYDSTTLGINSDNELYVIGGGGGTTYTAGTGINIDNEEISVDSDYIEAHKAYLADGDTLTDPQGLQDVEYYNHSSFDLSKFTVVGNPTVTNNGIASSFSGTSYITKSFTGLSGQGFKITLGFIFSNTMDGCVSRGSGTNASPRLDANSTDQTISMYFRGSSNVNLSIPYDIMNEGNTYIAVIEINSSTQTFKILDSNFNVLATKTNTSAQTVDIQSQIGTYYLGERNTSNYFNGAIDLKYLEVKNSGIPVFSGNKTGIDTYAIGENNVTIPYTLSKTGSKIVDSSYRTEVQAVYNQQGYAPYYTLDETNGNFTLPMGEIYGYITRLEGIVKDLQTRLTALESNINGGGASEPVQQNLLGMSSLSLGRPQLLDELNPEDELDTMDIEPIEENIQEEELEPQETEEETEEGGQDE